MIRILLLLVALLALATPIALSQPSGEAGASEVTLLAHHENGRNFFTLEGQGGHNPSIVVEPNATVTIRLVNVGNGVHNLVVRDVGKSDWVNAQHPEIEFAFVAPESGIFEYYCEPHLGQGMRGTIRVAGTAEPVRETPAPAVVALLGAFAAATLLASLPRRLR